MLKTLIAVLFGFLLSSSALADTGAELFMKAKQAELEAVAKANKGSARDEKFAQVFDTMLDYAHLARAALEDYWEGRSEAERAEFQGLLTRLVQRAYRKNLDKTANYEVTFKGEVAVEGGTLVQTVAKNKGDARSEPVSIDYVLSQVDGKWRVHDIVTEGSSLVKNYRRQFARIIRKKKPDEAAGFADLISRMKKKLDE